MGRPAAIVLRYTTVCITRYCVVNISTVGIVVSVPQRSVLETSHRQLSEDVSVGIDTLFLVVGQSSLENRPGGVWYIHQGGVIYTPGGCDIYTRGV